MKNIRAAKASVHTDDMDKFYEVKITESVKKTQEFGPDWKYVSMIVPHTSIDIVKLDSVTAVKHYTNLYPGKTICVHNFANYTTPGGGYIHGANAQEENLCEDSYLYNVLTDFEDTYYAWNKDHMNNDRYEDRALYSPDIIFGTSLNTSHDDIGFADVLTCAAPRISSKNTDKYLNDMAMYDRIIFIKSILAIKNPDIFITGAWGCGAFGQDAKKVAQDFKAIFLEDSPVKEIIFAIPDDKHYNIFKEVFAE